MYYRYAWGYALKTAAGLIAYFLLMKLLGLEQMHQLRLFNFAIILAGTVALHRKMFRTDEHHSYIGGLFAGMRMGSISILLFLAFMSVYASIIDPNFIEVLESSGVWGGKLTLFQSVIAIVFEGLASTVVISYASMQYFKIYSEDISEVRE
ncbi:MAG: hypothetical protein HWD92_09000 [Flavobacteriia bacterium]|nr:hypothetical protein [Flavobacteriia bacterium]